MSPEVSSRIAAIRQRAVEGTATDEECREAIRLMREDRRAAYKTSDTSRRKAAKAAIPDADALTDELANL